MTESHETPETGEAPATELEKQQKRLFGFVMLGPRTRQWSRLFVDEGGRVRQRKESLTEAELEKELKELRETVLNLGARPVLAVTFLTIVLGSLAVAFFPWQVAAATFGGGIVLAARTLGRIRARNRSTWERLEKQIRGA